MKTTTQNCGACYTCGNYKAFYPKGYCHFDREKHGYCTKSEKAVTCHDGCELWKNNHSCRTVRKEISLKSLDDILAHLSELKQIFAEEQDENKTNPM